MYKIIELFKQLVKPYSYGEKLKDFIAKNNPKTTADIEMLERQWLYRNHTHTGGQWL